MSDSILKYENLVLSYANKFNDLCKISICYNKSIFKVLFDFVRKNSLFSLKNIIKIALYSTKIGRKYHVKKYGKTVL